MTWTDRPAVARLRYSLPLEANRPTVAEIDLGALVHNFDVMSALVTPARVVAVVKAETNNAGANLILDMVAGDYVDRNYDAAAVDGRIVQIATLNGPKVTVNIAKVMVKRLTHTGSTLRPRTNADKAAMVAAIEAKVMPLLREGRVKPLMDSSFPLEKAADAHRRMETSAHIGKIVLAV